ncbi:pYEATS domain-containing protein [Kaistia sp. UC242_56]|uniref:pYEATS domain-containing protein n=1 Tax=Kaistia sp. UC242_56 TaxID=3374625 RepID=UPI0037B5CD0E
MFVEGPALDGDEVLFCLHDSFPKNVRRERFRGGSARIAVTAWGGFTVGIWLPR